jgi:hypothetical protein
MSKRLNGIIRLVELFYSMASEAEKLPTNSKDLKTVLRNIERLKTYQARKKYADLNLKHLSSGSSRVVLTFGDSVIKLAKNDKGLAQNRTETQASQLESKTINKVLSHAKNFAWIEVPLVKKMTKERFQKLTDIEFDDFGEALRYLLKNISGNTQLKKPKHYDTISKSSLFIELAKVGRSLDLMPGDLARLSSYGEKDGKVLLIDSGLSSAVFERFYEDDSGSNKSTKSSP